jgi:hypothetical protein
MNPAGELDAMLTDLAERAQEARDFQCLHGLERTETRKLARRMIALAWHWRREVAAVRPDTVSDVVALPPPRGGLARQASSPPSADQGEQRCQQARS